MPTHVHGKIEIRSIQKNGPTTGVEKPMQKVALALFLLFATSKIFAAQARSFELGLSMTSYQLQRQVNEDSGKTGFWGDNYYNIRMQYHVPVVMHLFFSPELDYIPASLLAKKSPDGNQSSALNYLLLPATYNVTNYVDISGGLAVMRYTLTTKGGTTILPNGGSESEFGLPGRTVTSTTLAWLVGSAFTYLRGRGGVNLLIQSPLSSEKRTLSLQFYAGYPLFSL